MEDNKTVTIDLGTRKLGVCVSRTGEDGRTEILYYNEFPSSGIVHGKVVNPAKLSNSLKNAVDGVERFLGIKINDVMVQQQKYDIREEEKAFYVEIDNKECISEENVKNLADMMWSDVAASLSPEEEVFGIVAQSFDVDNEIFIPQNDVIGMMGSKLTGHYKVYIGKSGNSNQIDAAFTKIGIDHVRPVFIPETIGDCLLSESDKDGGVALVDMGAGATSVSVFYAGVLRHYGAIPFGGDSITSDIRSMCGISETLSENIKLGFGGCMPDHLLSMGDKKLKITNKENGDKTEISIKYLSEIITARVGEILNAILYEIQKSGMADKLKNGIVITGGCSQMLNLRNYLKELSGYSSRIGVAPKSKFKADNNFFCPSASISAGLIERFNALGVNCATDAPERENGNEEDSAETILDVVSDGGASSGQLGLNLTGDDNEAERSRREREKEQRRKQKEEEKKRKMEAKRQKEEEDKQKQKENVGFFGGLFSQLNDIITSNDNNGNRNKEEDDDKLI